MINRAPPRTVQGALKGLPKSVGYGRLGRGTHGLLVVNQRREPPDGVRYTAEVVRVRVSRWSLAKRHSTLYADPVVLDRVSNWILATASGPARTGVPPSLSNSQGAERA